MVSTITNGHRAIWILSCIMSPIPEPSLTSWSPQTPGSPGGPAPILSRQSCLPLGPWAEGQGRQETSSGPSRPLPAPRKPCVLSPFSQKRLQPQSHAIRRDRPIGVSRAPLSADPRVGCLLPSLRDDVSVAAWGLMTDASSHCKRTSRGCAISLPGTIPLNSPHSASATGSHVTTSSLYFSLSLSLPVILHLPHPNSRGGSSPRGSATHGSQSLTPRLSPEVSSSTPPAGNQNQAG